MIIRTATKEDMDQLIRMRWDFTFEDDVDGNLKNEKYDDFYDECMEFLLDAFESGNWYIWVAEENGLLVSNMYIELIHKVPRPGRITYPFAYMTNVYTKPDFRGKGIGSRLISKINEWAKENRYEFIIVWPSDEGVDFYKKHGYQHCKEPMENMFCE
ncbi:MULTISPECIES: GNAT family N-acetyltransferase [Paenibacillus]|uniref:GCN5-related N-acetyltransferase n=2 Tax=Paenibacillus lactis TaxID=228574 RepID=G4H9K9_9BACL|nr:GNAT family N-acetyltransferase [Paenibacillus lactis]EHB68544.1 GCN5-related N-acetyltransferase [Paenibacillus lactis 154]MBP1893425.1 GNAT superfamily N-acetyltransferase [Paenibacillus lactis]GIO91046.1 N-acetyltransferase [Paenibacillus lactis]HAG01327.1 GNAT family N-acetyltransferase [Paenibacillus lactis]